MQRTSGRTGLNKALLVVSLGVGALLSTESSSLLNPCAKLTATERVATIARQLREAKAPFIDPIGILSDQDRGFPALSKLKVHQSIARDHPLAEFFMKSTPLTLLDLHNIFHSKHVNAGITKYHRDGRVPAAYYEPQESTHSGDETRYDASMWNRDAMVIEAANRRAGNWSDAHATNTLLWHTIGNDEGLRGNVIEFRNCGDTLARLRNGQRIIPIKWSLGDSNKIHVFENWNHIQLDAYWETLRGPFRFTNELSHGKASRTLPCDLNTDDLDIRSIDPHHGKFDEHLLVSAAYAFFGTLRAPHEGIWESHRAPGGTHALLAGLSCMDEMVDFFAREGWNALPNQPRDGFSFQEELLGQRDFTRGVLRQRIPERGYAVERPGRPYDMAMHFAVYPFIPHRESLNAAQVDTLLRTGYDHCMRPHGWIRWAFDKEFGPDTYVGDNYMNDPAPHGRGEFAKCPVDWYEQRDGDELIPNKRFHPARWTLYDAIYAARLYMRYIESGGAHIEAFERADMHLKRALSQLTRCAYQIVLAGKPGQVFKTPKGVLPEAWTFDRNRRELVPCHNGALLMSHGLLALALEKAVEAAALFESERGQMMLTLHKLRRQCAE